MLEFCKSAAIGPNIPYRACMLTTTETNEQENCLCFTRAFACSPIRSLAIQREFSIGFLKIVIRLPSSDKYALHLMHMFHILRSFLCVALRLWLNSIKVPRCQNRKKNDDDNKNNNNDFVHNALCTHAPMC